MLPKCLPGERGTPMEDFLQLRRDLSAARTTREMHFDDLHVTRENLRSLDVKIVAARRSGADSESLQSLLAQRDDLAVNVESVTRQYLAAKDAAQSLLEQLSAQSTPQEQVAGLNDA